jgi:hypothetical protein
MGLDLLVHASMPLKYWDDAFLATTFLINRTPTKLLSYDTPIHKLLGMTHDYSSFRVFGCACWSNLQPYNSHKFQLRSTRCVLLGYRNMHKGFKCLDISSGRIYVSCDAIFDELIFPFASLNSNAGAHYHSDVLLLPSPNTRDNGSTTMTNENTISVLPMALSPVQLQQIITPVAPVQDLVQANQVIPASSLPIIGTVRTPEHVPSSLSVCDTGVFASISA